ncbi:MAG: YlxR family protein [Patescibacteria group bacterium]|nr:YlxR family protein [Patescibacteria group bacterium]
MAKKKAQREKHVPIRMCIVTKEKKSKAELMRLVRVEDKVKVDPKGKERGRGANISMDMKIFDEATKKHLLERALKLGRKLSLSEIESLRKDFEKAIEERNFRQGNQPVVLKVDKEKWKKVVKNVKSRV